MAHSNANKASLKIQTKEDIMSPRDAAIDKWISIRTDSYKSFDYGKWKQSCSPARGRLSALGWFNEGELYWKRDSQLKSQEAMIPIIRFYDNRCVFMIEPATIYRFK